MAKAMRCALFATGLTMAFFGTMFGVTIMTHLGVVAMGVAFILEITSDD